MIKLTVDYNENVIIGASNEPVPVSEYYVETYDETFDIINELKKEKDNIKFIKFDYDVELPEDINE